MSFDQGEAFSWPRTGHTDRPAFPVSRRGYDRGQVEKYLDSLEDDVATLRSRVKKLEAELDGVQPRAKTAPEDHASQARYAAVSNHVPQVMQALDDEVERLLAQANEEVERMVSEARADADRIQQDAESKANEVRSLADDTLQEARKAADAIQSDVQEKAEETLATADALRNEARQQADRDLSDLKHWRRSLVNDLRRTRNTVDEALSDLDRAIDEELPANQMVLIVEDDGSEERVEG
jgi:DivIVA domain-containing protein